MAIIRVSEEFEKEIMLWQKKMKEKGFYLSKTQASDLFAELGSPKNNNVVIVMNFDHKRKLKNNQMDIFDMSNLFKL